MYKRVSYQVTPRSTWLTDKCADGLTMLTAAAKLALDDLHKQTA